MHPVRPTGSARIWTALAGIWLALSCASSSAGERDFQAKFDVTAKGMTVAETVWSYTNIGGRYRYESRSETKGLISLIRNDSVIERSEGMLNGNRITPALYSYDRSGKKQRQVRVDFDWNAGTAANSLGPNRWKMSVPDGTLDKISYLLAMMKDLTDGKRALAYEVADGGELKTYSLKVIGEQTITTPFGTFDVLKVSRKRRTSSRETIFWCAESLGYLPVRITHTESDGETYELNLRVATGL